MNALVALFRGLATLALMKNGGVETDLSKLLKYAELGVAAGSKGKEYLAHAADVVNTLVAEDRALTEQELVDLQASIEGKLARAAGVHLDAPKLTPIEPPADVPTPSTEFPAF